MLYIATLGSILDSQLSWESGKLQLARWSHRVVLFLVRTDPTRPTHPPDGLVWKVLYLNCYLSNVHQIPLEELLDHFKQITTLSRTFVHATFVQVTIVIPWKALFSCYELNFNKILWVQDGKNISMGNIMDHINRWQLSQMFFGRKYLLTLIKIYGFLKTVKIYETSEIYLNPTLFGTNILKQICCFGPNFLFTKNYS